MFHTNKGMKEGGLKKNVADVTVHNRLLCLKRTVILHTQFQYKKPQSI